MHAVREYLYLSKRNDYANAMKIINNIIDV